MRGPVETVDQPAMRVWVCALPCAPLIQHGNAVVLVVADYCVVVGVVTVAWYRDGQRKTRLPDIKRWSCGRSRVPTPYAGHFSLEPMDWAERYLLPLSAS
jgi:hypothetical protein